MTRPTPTVPSAQKPSSPLQKGQADSKRINTTPVSQPPKKG